MICLFLAPLAIGLIVANVIILVDNIRIRRMELRIWGEAEDFLAKTKAAHDTWKEMIAVPPEPEFYLKWTKATVEDS